MRYFVFRRIARAQYFLLGSAILLTGALVLGASITLSGYGLSSLSMFSSHHYGFYALRFLLYTALLFAWPKLIGRAIKQKQYSLAGFKRRYLVIIIFCYEIFIVLNPLKLVFTIFRG